MKKIFAFILATIMVLSLVPASAFAAITKADCSAGHKDPVEIGGQKATCTSSGYTIYKCNECGETYVSDPVEKLQHSWVSNPKLAQYDVEASCVYKTDGVRYVVCKDCKHEEKLEVNWNSTSVHTLKEGTGIGCEKLWACTTCKAEGYIAYDAILDDYVLGEEAEHDWEFDSVLEEPYWANGEPNDGLALYVCAADGCVDVKKVIISCPECECKETSKVLIKAAADATCTEDGSYAVYQCVDCSTLYVDYARDNDPEKVVYEALTDVNLDKQKTVADAVIKSVGHVAPASYAKVGCTRSYVCLVCKTNVNEVYHEPTRVVTSVSLPATCLTMGISYKTCSDCRTQWTEIVEPLGHLASEVPVIVASNCAVQGGKYTVCARGEACPLSSVVLNGASYKVISVEAFPLDKTKHVKVNKNAENAGTQSCTEAQLNIWICENGCADYATPVIEYKPAKGHSLITYKTIHNCMAQSMGGTLPIWTSRTIYICEECGLTSDQIIDPITMKSATVDVTDTTGNIKTTFSTEWEMLEYHGILRQVWGYNDDDELVPQDVEYRTNKNGVAWTANNWLVTETNPNGALHLINSVPATCSAAGIDTYYCSACNIYAYVTKGQLKHNNAIIGTATELALKVPGYAATCNTPGIYDSYTCLDCSAVYYYVGINHADNQKTGSLVINPCGSTLYDGNGDGKPDAIRDCNSSRGTKYYECQVCNTCYTSSACTKEYVPSGHNWKDAVAGVAATCNTDGTIEVRYCNTCKLVEINAVYVIDGEEVRNTFASKDNYWKKNKSSLSTTITAPYVSNTVTVSVNKKSGAVSFLCDTVTTSTCPVVVNKTNHYNPKGDLHTHTVDCAVDCAQVWAESYISSEQNWDNTSDHTEAEFTKYLCAACDYEIISDYAPAAAGHMNAKGEILGNDCETGAVVADRVCVLCIAAGKSETQATIDDGHDFEYDKNSSSTATCVTAGYQVWKCKDCGAFKVSNTVVAADPVAYHEALQSWNPMLLEVSGYGKLVGSKEDYAHNGSYYWACALCNYQLTELVEEDCPGVGVELGLEADASSYSPGSSVYVTVSLDSLKGVEVWGANFNVLYDVELVEFVKAINVDASGFTGTAYAPIKAVIEDNVTTYVPTGAVNVAISSADGVVIKGASDVIVLEFKVVNTQSFNEAAQFIVGNIDDGTSAAEVVVVGSNGKPIKSMYEGADGFDGYDLCTIGLEAFADLDNDGKTTMFDAFDLYYLILTDGYDVLADIDNNGTVNEADLNKLYDYIIGKITLEEIIHPKEEEEKERVIEYDQETGEIIYDSLCDFNENGKIDTVSELAALSGRIDPNLFW